MSLESQSRLSNRCREIDIDILVKDGHVLTLDRERAAYNPGYVAIKGGKIVAVGPVEENVAQYRAKCEINASNCLVLPGFVNTHTHAAMALLRGYADDMNLQEWLFNHIFPAEAKCMNEESVYWGTRIAIAEMIRNGITTFSDGYFFTGSVSRAVKECGIRAVVGQGVLDYPTPDCPDPEKSMTLASNFLDKYGGYSPRVYPSIFCHSPYTCSKRTLAKMKELTREHKALFQIHLSETEREVEEFEDKHKTRPTFYLRDLGILDKDTLVAHAVWLNKKEIEVLKKHHACVSHVVSSNMKLASGVAPLPRFLEANLAVGIGTDGCASNNRLDLLRDIDLAAKLHKLWQGDATVVPAMRLVEMITLKGAACIGLGERIGSIESDKLADITILSLNKPHLTPLYDPYSHLVYCARGSDVRDVIVGGEIIMRNRKILAFDEQETIEKVSRITGNLMKI